MTSKTAVTAIVVTHNSASRIGDTLDELLADPAGPRDIVVVDTASTDGTEQIVAGRSVRWMGLAENFGFGAAANRGAIDASEPVIAVLTDDVTVTAGWLSPLLAALDEPGVGAAMPTVELADRPGRFNTSGGAVAVSGLAWITDLGMRVPADEPEMVDVPFPSGAAFVMSAATWARIGGFRDDFFLYHEDTDLGWRLRMAGLRTVRVPAATVSHHYEFGRNPDKLTLLERNRLRMIITNYRRSTLALLAPVLVLHEIGVLWVAVRDRWLWAKVRSWRSGAFSAPSRRRHRELQASRTVGDAQILRGSTGSVAAVPIPDVGVPRGARILDAITSAWVALVLPLVRVADRRRGLDDRGS